MFDVIIVFASSLQDLDLTCVKTQLENRDVDQSNSSGKISKSTRILSTWILRTTGLRLTIGVLYAS